MLAGSLPGGPPSIISEISGTTEFSRVYSTFMTRFSHLKYIYCKPHATLLVSPCDEALGSPGAGYKLSSAHEPESTMGPSGPRGGTRRRSFVSLSRWRRQESLECGRYVIVRRGWCVSRLRLTHELRTVAPQRVFNTPLYICITIGIFVKNETSPMSMSLPRHLSLISHADCQ